MNVITHNKDVKYILLPKNYQALYIDLSKILSSENMIFAKPEAYKQQKYTDWVFKSQEKLVKAVKFSETSDNEIKEAVADRLQTAREELERNAEKVPGFKPLIPKLITIPSNDYIMYFENEEGDYYVSLFAWGCVATAQEYTTDAVGEIISKYQSDRAEVIAKLVYYDESPAATTEFYFNYKENEKKKKTNAAGEKRLGKIKIDSSFELYVKKGDEKVYVTPFTVSETQKYYEVTIPFYTSGNILVQNQSDEPVAEHKIFVHYLDRQKEYTTDNQGNVILENLEAGTTITVKDGEDSNLSQNYQIEKEDNQFIFKLVKPVPAIIKVIDGEDNHLPNFEIQVAHNDSTNNHITDENAEIRLDKLRPGTVIHVSEKKYGAKADFKITEKAEENNFLFKIELPEATILKFKLVDHKKKPVVNQILTLTYKEKRHQVVTDENGYCSLQIDEVGDKDFVTMSMEVDKKQKIKKLKLLKR